MIEFLSLPSLISCLNKCLHMSLSLFFYHIRTNLTVSSVSFFFSWSVDGPCGQKHQFYRHKEKKAIDDREGSSLHAHTRTHARPFECTRAHTHKHYSDPFGASIAAAVIASYSSRFCLSAQRKGFLWPRVRFSLYSRSFIFKPL